MEAKVEREEEAAKEEKVAWVEQVVKAEKEAKVAILGL
jgi:hypothetical protein